MDTPSGLQGGGRPVSVSQGGNSVTNEQLAALIRGGRREHLLTLWKQVERFAAWQARRWSGYGNTRGISVDDLMQVAFLALLDALEDYDPERGKFLTRYSYALKTAFSEALGIRTERDRRDPINYAVSLDAPLTDESETTLHEVTPDPVDQYKDTERGIWLAQLRAALDQQLDTLPPKQAEVLRMRFYQGMTLKECGQRCGVAMEAIRQRERTGLRNLAHGKRAARLREFVDDRSDFYGVHGVHSLEGLIVHREHVLLRILDRSS